MNDETIATELLSRPKVYSVPFAEPLPPSNAGGGRSVVRLLVVFFLFCVISVLFLRMFFGEQSADNSNANSYNTMSGVQNDEKIVGQVSKLSPEGVKTDLSTKKKNSLLDIVGKY